jgi:hypothetical protein
MLYPWRLGLLARGIPLLAASAAQACGWYWLMGMEGLP